MPAIRTVYGLEKEEEGSLKTIPKGFKSEIIADLIVDKAICNVPIFRIPTNIICAKAMTWRLGILEAL